MTAESSRTEFSQVVAQPDGHLRFESAVVPQRARRGSGWADVDLNLSRGADGRLRTAVSVADVAFSGDGSGPLVTLTRAGQTVTLSWPGTLPKPTVDKSSAKYSEVMPDVDLVVRATETGFTPHSRDQVRCRCSAARDRGDPARSGRSQACWRRLDAQHRR
ncbi:hypothetical protein GCM10010172_63120 [Paractinoplanes ferrugineus]|uniref:Uncharacterized protein n=1 Tax=Paractinoplanes ferrugineus TaxID=113564 RepID=A0A919J6L3_9ACTN|nr:hypothetical protein Afe05nite_66500 [Actinoplanes ferrugineus]